MKKNLLVLLIIIVGICLPAIFPLFHKGFFTTDDGEWMIIRFSSFYQAFADGQIPVRFLHRLNFDFGYPVATFLYPGFMYFGIPFHLLKIGFVDTIKIILGLSVFGTTIFTFFWLDKVFKNKLAAFVGSLVSLYIPYHLYDIYIRGSVGEIFALLWVPFILWMIERESIFFTSIGITFLILSHNTLAVLFLPLIILYMLIKILNSKDRRVQIYMYTSILVIAFGMAAFFIVPAILELQYTQFAQTKISNPFQYFADINLIGISSIIILFLALIVFIYKYKDIKYQKQNIWLFLLFSLVAVFFSSSLANIFWQFIPSSFIQFPFRLLSYLVISCAFLAAFIVSCLKNWYKISFVFIIIIILSVSTHQQLSKVEFFDKGNDLYSTNEATTTVGDEYMPTWVKEKPVQRAEQKVEVINGKAEIKNISYNNKQITFNILVKEDGMIRINTIYWPGWEVFADNKKVLISYNNPKGVIELVVEKGNHQIRAQFQETSLRFFSDSISLLSLLLLILLSVKRKEQKAN